MYNTKCFLTELNQQKVTKYTRARKTLTLSEKQNKTKINHGKILFINEFEAFRSKRTISRKMYNILQYKHLNENSMKNERQNQIVPMKSLVCSGRVCYCSGCQADATFCSQLIE